jgi:hypothetical protein
MYVVKFPNEPEKNKMLPAFIVEPSLIKKCKHFYITKIPDMEVIRVEPRPIQSDYVE